MKILLISDHEEKYLWDDWTKTTAEKLSDIDLILSAGDLHPLYLEFLVTMLNVPLVYVRGNHDGYYDERPPEGCDNADGQLVEVVCGRGDSKHKIRILGFGGSMRYKDGAADMYTEEEMYARVRKAERALLKRRALDVLFASAKKGGRAGLDLGPAFDILLTHRAADSAAWMTCRIADSSASIICSINTARSFTATGMYIRNMVNLQGMSGTRPERC